MKILHTLQGIFRGKSKKAIYQKSNLNPVQMISSCQDLLGRLGDMGDDAKAAADCGVTGTAFKSHSIRFIHIVAHIIRLVLSDFNLVM